MVIVIPVRLESSRLYGKVLLDLKGKPIIQHVYERCKESNADEVYIITNNKKICNVVKHFTDKIIISKEEHPNGTSRLFESLPHINDNIIINVQGDEPFIDPELINAVGSRVSESYPYPVSAMVKSQNKYKVNVIDNGKDFSRTIVTPYKHIGIYGLTPRLIRLYNQLKETDREVLESLEQLRFTDNGICFNMVEWDNDLIDINTQEDYDLAKRL